MKQFNMVYDVICENLRPFTLYIRIWRKISTDYEFEQFSQDCLIVSWKGFEMCGVLSHYINVGGALTYANLLLLSGSELFLQFLSRDLTT